MEIHLGPPTKTELRLVFLLLLQYSWVTTLEISLKEQCDQSRAKHVQMFALGKPFQLCCLMDQVKCQKLPPGSQLVLVKDGGHMDNLLWNITNLDECTLVYSNHNATALYSGRYKCIQRGQKYPFQRLQVKILDKPVLPTKVIFKASEFNEINIVVLRGSPDELDEYQISLSQGLAPVYTSKMDCLNESICQWNNSAHTNRNRNVAHKNYSVALTVSRPSIENPIQTVKHVYSFNPIQFIVPEPVQNVQPVSISSEEAFVMFEVPETTRRYINWMNFDKHPLTYKVVLNKTQGYPQLVVTKVKKTTQSFRSQSSHDFLAVKFTNLTAFTEYTVSVSGFSDGGESPTEMITFTTNKTAPALPPRVDDFGFSRVDDVKKNATILVLMWKPLPTDSRGGSNLTYDVVVTSDRNNIPLQELNSDGMNAVVHLPLNPQAMVVRIWSRNEVGRSANYSRIWIPSNKDFTQPRMVVEYRLDKKVNVHIKTDGQTKYDKFAVLHCKGKRDEIYNDVDVCQDYPRLVMLEPDAANATGVVGVEIPLGAATEQSEMTCGYTTQVKYFEFGNMSQTLTDHKDATAYVSLTGQWTDRGSCSGHSVDTMSSLTKQLPDSSSLPEVPVYEKFFIAVQENGKWMGFHSAECYYDSSITESAVITSQPDNILVRFKQECDQETPKQFLVSYFELYSCADEDCKNNMVMVSRVKNNIFNANELKLPPDAKFVSVKSYRSDGYFNSDPSVFAVAPRFGSDSTSEHFLPILLSISLVAIFLGLFIFIFYKCKKRKQHFQIIHDSSIPILGDSYMDPEAICSIPEEETNQVNFVDSTSFLTKHFKLTRNGNTSWRQLSATKAFRCVGDSGFGSEGIQNLHTSGNTSESPSTPETDTTGVDSLSSTDTPETDTPETDTPETDTTRVDVSSTSDTPETDNTGEDNMDMYGCHGFTRVPYVDKNSKKQPLHEVTTEKQPLHEVTTEKQPLHEVTTEKQPLHEVTTEKQPLHEDTTEEQPLDEVTSEKQPLHEDTTEEQPLHEDTSEKQPLHEDTTFQKNNPFINQP